MKVPAIACDLTSCPSVARASEANDDGVPAGWLEMTVSQDSRKVLDGVFCSSTCLATYVELDGAAPRKRRRRTRAEIEADNARATAAESEEPAAVASDPGLLSTE